MREHILIVDDEAGIRQLMVHFLDTQGYAVSQAATAHAALELVQQAPVDLVITDWTMPGMTGLELTQELIAQNPHRPVLMMSANGEASAIDQALDIGVSDYLVKPFNLKDAIKRIDQVLERRRMASQNQTHPQNNGASKGMP